MFKHHFSLQITSTVHMKDFQTSQNQHFLFGLHHHSYKKDKQKKNSVKG